MLYRTSFKGRKSDEVPSEDIRHPESQLSQEELPRQQEGLMDWFRIVRTINDRQL